jgi:hypothetical protein
MTFFLPPGTRSNNDMLNHNILWMLRCLLLRRSNTRPVAQERKSTNQTADHSSLYSHYASLLGFWFLVSSFWFLVSGFEFSDFRVQPETRN